MRRLAAGCLGLLVVGVACEAPDERSWAREPVGQIALAGKVCPGADRVEGIDVSYYQPNIDWAAVKASGREFAIVRVSDGLTNPDPDFAKNWAGAKSAGLIRGVYQFFRPEEDAAAQAKMVLDGIGNKLEPGDLPPVIDIEAADGLSASKVAAAVKTWVSTVEGALGRKPILYTGNSFWVNSVGNPSYKDYPLWIAAYPYCYDSIKSGSYCPTIPDQWGAWTFWQYSDGKNTPNQGCTINPPSVPGVGQSCDRNYFNGTLAQLQMLAGGGSNGVEYKASYVSQTYPLASAPAVEATVGQVLTGSITFKNAGSKPWEPGQTFLAPMPRDQDSPFQAPSWINGHRTGSVAQEVPPGQEGTFTWDLEPSQAGDFSLFFGLVQEGVTWFADPPLGGGPADNVIQVKLTVKPGAGGTGGSAGGTGGASAGGMNAGGTSAAGTSAGGTSAAGTSAGGTSAGGKAGAGHAGGPGTGGASGSSGQAGAAGARAGAAGAGASGGTSHAGAGGAVAGAGAGGDSSPVVVETVTADDDKGGCGCRVNGAGGPSGGAGAVVAAVLLGWRRRRGGRGVLAGRG